MIAKCGKCGREQNYTCAIDLVHRDGWFMAWGNPSENLCPTCYAEFKKKCAEDRNKHQGKVRYSA